MKLQYLKNCRREESVSDILMWTQARFLAYVLPVNYLNCLFIRYIHPHVNHILFSFHLIFSFRSINRGTKLSSLKQGFVFIQKESQEMLRLSLSKRSNRMVVMVTSGPRHPAALQCRSGVNSNAVCDGTCLWDESKALVLAGHQEPLAFWLLFMFFESRTSINCCIKSYAWYGRHF